MREGPLPSSPRDAVKGRMRHLANSLLNYAWLKACELGTVGPDDTLARKFGAFGKGSLIGFPPGVVYNHEYIHIGRGTMIGPLASLAVGMAPGQEMISNPVISIGDRCVIGRGSSIVGHFSIEIGDEVQTGPNVYITDQNHAYSDPDKPIGRQWPVERAVKVGDGSWLGTGVVVLPGAWIGKNVVVGAGSIVSGELPDHCVAVGAPARVVKLYVEGQGWRSIPRARSAVSE